LTGKKEREIGREKRHLLNKSFFIFLILFNIFLILFISGRFAVANYTVPFKMIEAQISNKKAERKINET
jgi:hypothetical protein